MRSPSPSAGIAWLIRFVFHWPLDLHMRLNRSLIVFADWLEDGRVLDHPTPWLAGLMLAALLIWLVRDVRA